MSADKILAPGTIAPDFRLKTTPDQSVALSDFRGRRTILAFYPADFSPVCSDELDIFNVVLDELQRHDAQLLAISVDGVWCHLAFAHAHKLRFPLLSDAEPKGAVARGYGAYDDGEGVCQRALFVIDRDGAIAWSYWSPAGVNPGADGILATLERLDGGAPEEARP
jgi:peroxiredoxin